MENNIMSVNNPLPLCGLPFMEALPNIKLCLEIERVIFNAPYTIVLWSDGSKTIVKADPKTEYSKKEGLLLAATKRILGNSASGYKEALNEWLSLEEMGYEDDSAYFVNKNQRKKTNKVSDLVEKAATDAILEAVNTPYEKPAETETENESEQVSEPVTEEKPVENTEETVVNTEKPDSEEPLRKEEPVVAVVENGDKANERISAYCLEINKEEVISSPEPVIEYAEIPLEPVKNTPSCEREEVKTEFYDSTPAPETATESNVVMYETPPVEEEEIIIVDEPKEENCSNEPTVESVEEPAPAPVPNASYGGLHFY